MSFFRKVDNQRYVPGLEWVILKKLPKYLFAGTLIPALMSLLVHYFPSQFLSGGDIAKLQMSMDIVLIAIVITVWTAVFTIAIGCIVVRIMKGPTYMADSYKMPDSNYPGKGDREE